jgi:hypothetical protein
MATEAGTQPAQQTQPQAQDRPEEGPLAIALRQQIVDAMDPVMDDLVQAGPAAAPADPAPAGH